LALTLATSPGPNPNRGRRSPTRSSSPSTHGLPGRCVRSEP
jgi:hypothetical protein